MQTSEYVDPFTGAARYTPATTSGASTTSNGGVNLDPFTGIYGFNSILNQQYEAIKYCIFFCLLPIVRLIFRWKQLFNCTEC